MKSTVSPAPPSTTPAIPESQVRGSTVLIKFDNAMAAIDGWLHRWLPAEGNPLAQSGRAVNLALLVAVVSGILLLFWYSSSLHQAYPSLEAIQGRTLGGWVRAVHRYSSDLVLLLLIVHAGRNLFARKFTGPRWLPWVTGMAMLSLIWFIGWTGYWLVWDQPAQQVAMTSMRFLDVLPIFGEPLSRLFLTDRLVPSLLFFVVFFLHMLLPLLIAVGLALHLVRLSRVRLLPDRRLTIALLTALATASFLVPAPLDAPAEMAVKAVAFKVDGWYLTPLALGLRFQSGGLWMAIGGTFLLGASLPWLLGKRLSFKPAENATPQPALFQTHVHETRCHACTQCVQDCPYEAVHMVARTDGKPFPARAWVDPMRCVGCAVCVGSCDSEAMSLPWFDPRIEEKRIHDHVEEVIAEGHPAWIALVAADIDGGMDRFNTDQWSRRLPGYLVHAVPTASWVRPKFVERLLKYGVKGVLIVRDARAESAARDGNQWVEQRLSGEREPRFRPNRLGPGAGTWRVEDYTHGSSRDLRSAAIAFRKGASPARRIPWGPRAIGAALILSAAVTAAAVLPSHLQVTNPADPDPEFVFSFKAFGDRAEAKALSAEEEASLPIHMRGGTLEKAHRQPVRVRLTINGESQEREFPGKGISRDGPSIGVWRLPLEPSAHAISIDLITGSKSDPESWSGTVETRSRRIHVITYEPGNGFVSEGE